MPAQQQALNAGNQKTMKKALKWTATAILVLLLLYITHTLDRILLEHFFFKSHNSAYPIYENIRQKIHVALWFTIFIVGLLTGLNFLTTHMWSANKWTKFFLWLTTIVLLTELPIYS